MEAGGNAAKVLYNEISTLEYVNIKLIGKLRNDCETEEQQQS